MFGYKLKICYNPFMTLIVRKVIPMLKLSVMGHSKLLHPFINHFKNQPFYEIKSECSHAVVEASSGLEEVSAFFEFKPVLDQPRDRQSFWVEMKTKNGHELRFELLDGNVVDMGEGTVVIYGKNYDIFACQKPSIDHE